MLQGTGAGETRVAALACLWPAWGCELVLGLWVVSAGETPWCNPQPGRSDSWSIALRDLPVFPCC